MTDTLTREQRLTELDERSDALNGSKPIESSRHELGADTRRRRWSAFANGAGTWGLCWWDDKRSEWRSDVLSDAIGILRPPEPALARLKRAKWVA